jgi:putative intracellular protease/amidase
MAQKTALFIVAEGSEELELVAPVDILRRANVKFFLYVQMLMI